MKVIGYLVSDGTLNVPMTAILVESEEEVSWAAKLLKLDQTTLTVNPVLEPTNLWY